MKNHNHATKIFRFSKLFSVALVNERSVSSNIQKLFCLMFRFTAFTHILKSWNTFSQSETNLIRQLILTIQFFRHVGYSHHLLHDIFQLKFLIWWYIWNTQFNVSCQKSAVYFQWEERELITSKHCLTMNVLPPLVPNPARFLWSEAITLLTVALGFFNILICEGRRLNAGT